MEKSGLNRRDFFNVAGAGLAGLAGIVSNPVLAVAHEEDCGCSEPKIEPVGINPFYRLWMANGLLDIDGDGARNVPYEIIGAKSRFRHAGIEPLSMVVHANDPEQVGKDVQLEIWNSDRVVHSNHPAGHLYLTSPDIVISWPGINLFPGNYTAFVKLNGVPKARSEFRVTTCDVPLSRAYKHNLETQGVRLTTCNSARDHDGKGYIGPFDYLGEKDSFRPGESLIVACSVDGTSGLDGRKLDLKLFNSNFNSIGQSLDLNSAYVNGSFMLPTGNIMPEIMARYGGEGHYAVAAIANGKTVGVKHFDVRQGCGRC